MEKIGRFLGAFLCVVLFMGIYSIAEEITLTTYYPAPYGAYEELSVEDGFVIGATYAGAQAAPASGMIVEGNVGIGTTNPATKLDVNGIVSATGFSAGGAATGVSGTFTTQDGKTVTVTNGIVTSII